MREFPWRSPSNNTRQAARAKKSWLTHRMASHHSHVPLEQHVGEAERQDVCAFSIIHDDDSSDQATGENVAFLAQLRHNRPSMHVHGESLVLQRNRAKKML
ncbi:hypothetical protein QOT17_015572 [Balamuthia mandrillaris]